MTLVSFIRSSEELLRLPAPNAGDVRSANWSEGISVLANRVNPSPPGGGIEREAGRQGPGEAGKNRRNRPFSYESPGLWADVPGIARMPGLQNAAADSVP